MIVDRSLCCVTVCHTRRGPTCDELPLQIVATASTVPHLTHRLVLHPGFRAYVMAVVDRIHTLLALCFRAYVMAVVDRIHTLLALWDGLSMLRSPNRQCSIRHYAVAPSIHAPDTLSVPAGYVTVAVYRGCPRSWSLHNRNVRS